MICSFTVFANQDDLARVRDSKDIDDSTVKSLIGFRRGTHQSFIPIMLHKNTVDGVLVLADSDPSEVSQTVILSCEAWEKPWFIEQLSIDAADDLSNGFRDWLQSAKIRHLSVFFDLTTPDAENRASIISNVVKILSGLQAQSPVQRFKCRHLTAIEYITAKSKEWLSVAIKAVVFVIIVALLGNSTFGVWVKCRFFDSAACAPQMRFAQFAPLNRSDSDWSAEMLKSEYGYMGEAFENYLQRAYRFRVEDIGIGNAGKQTVVIKWLPDLKKEGSVREHMVLYGCRRLSENQKQIIDCSQDAADSIIRIPVESEFYLEEQYLFFFTRRYADIEVAIGFPNSKALPRSIPRLAVLSITCDVCQERQIALTVPNEGKGALP